jgi:hypothetical protein
MLSAPTCCVQLFLLSFFVSARHAITRYGMASVLTGLGHDTLADTSTAAMHCSATNVHSIQLCERLLAEQPTYKLTRP